MAYLHDHGIVHRDLKPENLLFRTPEDNADLLIADFGLSRIMDEEAFHVLTTTCGTPGYMAPEIFRKSGHGKPVYVPFPLHSIPHYSQLPYPSPHHYPSLMTCSDVWAIGVITYFLLCGYTPFDRESNLEEMQAILVADYSFTPLEYWRGVSTTARQFIKRCLTVDPKERMTAHEALAHPWINPSASDAGAGDGTGEDLLPVVKKNFNARRTLHAAIDTIRAINKLREGGAHGMMNGAVSRNPNAAAEARQQPAANKGAAIGAGNKINQGGDGAAADDGDVDMGGNGDRMEVEGEPGERFVHQGGDEMEIDGQGHGKGQTEEQIRAQERRIREVSGGLWSRR